VRFILTGNITLKLMGSPYISFQRSVGELVLLSFKKMHTGGDLGVTKEARVAKQALLHNPELKVSLF
jgi:hypothetical protein